MKLSTLAIVLIIVTNTFAQKGDDNVKFSLRFTGCFKNDTLSLKINDAQVFENKIATTDRSDAVSNIYVFQNNNGLWIDAIKFQEIKIRKRIMVDITINRQREKFEISLGRGKHLLIDKCNGKGSFIGWINLRVSQFKNRPLFD